MEFNKIFLVFPNGIELPVTTNSFVNNSSTLILENKKYKIIHSEYKVMNPNREGIRYMSQYLYLEEVE